MRSKFEFHGMFNGVAPTTHESGTAWRIVPRESHPLRDKLGVVKRGWAQFERDIAIGRVSVQISGFETENAALHGLNALPFKIARFCMVEAYVTDPA